MTEDLADPESFWKRKLAAFLQHPPGRFASAEAPVEGSARAMSAAGLIPAKHPQWPDWEAASAGQIPLPRLPTDGAIGGFDGLPGAFHHPLGGLAADGAPVPCVLRFEEEVSGLDQLEGEDSQVQPELDTSTLKSWSQVDIDRARFFAHWRLWRRWACEKDWRFNFLPADTRLPDHTIWHHMQVTSALAGCAAGDDPAAPLRPAFLKLQIGPVQDFIAAARSIRDLWSGSYLLSWLVAAGLKRLSELAGPDAVLFPSLWGQPLFDLHWRDSLWTQISLSNDPSATNGWDAIRPSHPALLTPNLPNVFLALVPSDHAEKWAGETEQAIRDEFETGIAGAVWRACEEKGLTKDEAMISRDQRKTRYEEQIKSFLSISWQVTPWPEDLEGALAAAPTAESVEPINIIREMAEKLLPAEHRDARHYHHSGMPDFAVREPARLKSRGLAWSVLLARNARDLDGVRQLRAFAGRSGAWTPDTANNKDSLNGKDEAVAGGKTWQERVPAPWKHLFKHEGDWIGAVTLVKRLWHLAYLQKEWKLPTGSGEFSMPNLHSLAAGKPFGNDENDEPEADEKYFAVLAFDGDEIGKWISGAKTPPFRSQLADYQDGTGAQRQGMLEYFERDAEFAEFLNANRPLSPSYHLQFSEALGNFAIHCAASIVEAHQGRLIYCGGDDVLALLPANHALECAHDLNRAFTGQSPARSVKPRLKGEGSGESGILSEKSRGFLASALMKDDRDVPIPFTVPGPAASASVGIAIAHFKSPLQDVVRAAQQAEKRAKNQLGRAAVAVFLFKRSGEITTWGTKWKSGGLALYEAMAEALDNKALSSKFPHRVCALLEPYLIDDSGLMRQNRTLQDADGFDAAAVIGEEFAFAISRQSAQGRKKENERLLVPLLNDYLAKLKAEWAAQNAPEKPPRITLSQELLRAVTGLCATVAFAHRTRPKEESAPNQES